MLKYSYVAETQEGDESAGPGGEEGGDRNSCKTVSLCWNILMLQQKGKVDESADPVETRMEIETLARLFLNSYVAETG